MGEVVVSRWLAAFDDAIRDARGVADKTDTTDKTPDEQHQTPHSVGSVTGGAYSEQPANQEVVERAALVSAGCDIPAAWADMYVAMKESSPAGCSYWPELVADAERFLDQRNGDWARKAVALGWSIAAVFGRDVLTPLDKRYQPGLVGMIRGGRIIAMTADSITVKFPSISAPQIYRRYINGAWDAMAQDSTGSGLVNKS